MTMVKFLWILLLRRLSGESSLFPFYWVFSMQKGEKKKTWKSIL